MRGHVLSYGEKLHHTIIIGAVEGQTPLERPKNSYISQLKKDAEINTHAGIKRFAKDREKWRTKLNVINQTITG